jgi:hypothetical protein
MISGGAGFAPIGRVVVGYVAAQSCQETCILFSEDGESWQRTSNEHLRRTQVMFEIERMSKETSRKWGVSLVRVPLPRDSLRPYGLRGHLGARSRISAFESRQAPGCRGRVASEPTALLYKIFGSVNRFDRAESNPFPEILAGVPPAYIYLPKGTKGAAVQSRRPHHPGHRGRGAGPG